MKYQEFKRTPHLDEGCALFYRDSVAGDTLFHILLPLDTIPAFSGEVEEIEYGYTTMDSMGKIRGRKSLNETESEFYWVRDFANKLKSLKGRQLELLVILPDYMGYRLRGEIDYTYNEIVINELATGTMSITPSWMDTEHIDDVSDLIQETATIDEIDPIINISIDDTPETGKVIPISTNPLSGVTATFAYQSKSYATSGTSEIVEVKYDTNGTKLTIKPLELGREIVKITTSAENCASWDTYITVEVE